MPELDALEITQALLAASAAFVPEMKAVWSSPINDEWVVYVEFDGKNFHIDKRSYTGPLSLKVGFREVPRGRPTIAAGILEEYLSEKHH